MSADRRFYLPKKPRECDFLESCMQSLNQIAQGSNAEAYYSAYCIRNFQQCQVWQYRMRDTAVGYKRGLTAEAHESVKDRMPPR